MNQIILIGRLTKDPELKYTQSGKALCKFTLAVNRRFARDGEQNADFINIQVWGKQAESCGEYLAKGRQCAVSGRLQISSYDGNDGVRRYSTDVIADSVEFLGGGSNQNQTSNDNALGGEEVSIDTSDLDGLFG